MFGKNQIIQNLVAYLRYQNLYAIKEKCQHGSIQVPYSYYDCGIPDYFTSVPLHWHSEMELNYINSDKSVIKEKIWENPRHLWENILSSCIRDIHVNHRVRRSLPQITRIYTDVGARDVDYGFI